MTVFTVKVLPAQSEVTQEGWKPRVGVNVDGNARKVVPAGSGNRRRHRRPSPERANGMSGVRAADPHVALASRRETLQHAHRVTSRQTLLTQAGRRLAPGVFVTVTPPPASPPLRWSRTFVR